MIFLAIFLPTLYFLFRGAIFQAIVCFVLQLTLIGWIPAAAWAVIHNGKHEAERRHREMLNVMKDR